MYCMISFFPQCVYPSVCCCHLVVGFLDIGSQKWVCLCGVCLCHLFSACFNCGGWRNPRLHVHVLRARIRANYEERRGRQSGRDRKGRPGLQLASLLVRCSLSHVSLSLLLYCKVLQLLILVSLFSLQHLRSVWPIRAWLMGECGD